MKSAKGKNDTRRGSMAHRIRALCGLALVLPLAGCSMVSLQQDLSEAKDLGLISGPVTVPGEDADNVIVALYRQTEDGPVLENIDLLSSRIRDYVFILKASVPHLLVAFQDRDGDRVLDPGEPAGMDRVVVDPMERLSGREIQLAAGTEMPAALEIDFSELELLEYDSIPIASGEVTNLEDPRFSKEQAEAGMWSPLTSAREVGGGIYFLEPYDPERIPILFVHGIGGSPLDFKFLDQGLDRDRYQAWVYQYPSGIRLERGARALARLLDSLREELDCRRMFVTAPSWIDMQPGSEFQESLRAELPDTVPHHLFFGFQTRRNPLMLYSHDTVVSVVSQLPLWAQEQARRIYGFDLDHTGILNDDEAAEAYFRILDQAGE